ncbi:MAG TPA: hypothetical protein VFZ53_27505 [Polyangiaceae bacterium]
MRRSDGVLLTILSCAACGESASRVETRPPAVATASPPVRAPEPPRLEVLARPEGASEPARILEPRDGVTLDAAAASALVIRVSGPMAGGGTTLVLSLDGARPRPVSSGTLALAELVAPGASLEQGAHDLVLAAVDAAGVAHAASSGGVAWARFFVGQRPPASPPRVVCLAPSGTVYGKAPRFALDYVVVAGTASAVDVTVSGAGGSRRARAEGPGPFALGAFPAGDHEVTLAAATEPAALLGRCVFTVNPELERPR